MSIIDLYCYILILLKNMLSITGHEIGVEARTPAGALLWDFLAPQWTLLPPERTADF
jgi:hypothetical protein